MDSLRDELRSLEGVADAEIDETLEAPSGVKVRLTADADAAVVGAEVQRILAAHGMRSRLTGLDEPVTPLMPVPNPPPSEARDVPPIPTVPPPTQSSRLAPAGEADVAPAPSAPGSDAALGGMPELLLRETPEAMEVTVRRGDRSVVRTVGLSRQEMVQGAVEAMADFLGGDVEVLDIANLGSGDHTAIAVLVRSSGAARAGAVVVGVTDAYAAARALWSALA